MILPGVTLFPGAMLPLFIFEPRYRLMLENVLEGNRVFAVAAGVGGGEGEEQAAPVAGVGYVRAAVENDDGTSHLILNGLARVRVKDVRHEEYPELDVELIDESGDPSVKAEALAVKARELALNLLRSQRSNVVQSGGEEKDYVESMGLKSFSQFEDLLTELRAPGQIADTLASSLVANAEERQKLLETLALEERLDRLIALLMRAEGN